MNENILKRAQEWVGTDYDENTRNEIQALIDAGNEKELTDRFWKDLEFGTGGLRGIIGSGTALINIYNIRKATQGLANYILQQGGAEKGVVIGRDSRNFSLEFAQEAASVLVANGIKVYFFKDVCPTPITSFTILQTGAIAGIMNTASHNPKEYNGYKVYWQDGAQLTPPHDGNVMAEIAKISSQKMIKVLKVQELEQNSLFEYCDNYAQKYLEVAQNFPKDKSLIASSDLKILYSPLHGAGYKYTPQLLTMAGFKNVSVLPIQSTPDGNFPSASYPNPEEMQAMQVGVDYAKQHNFDIFIATDPDADRIGVAYKNAQGEFALLNGNQIGILIADYLSRYPIADNSFVVSTIVSTPLIGVIAHKKGLNFYEVLTGFKWISALTQEKEKEGASFLFGMEESHGYNISPLVRDKDGVSATLIISELAAYHQKLGHSLDKVLLEIYKSYGYYRESLENMSFPGAEGAEIISNMMKSLRSTPPKEILGFKVVECRDYSDNSITKNGVKSEGKGLPLSNVFGLHLENGSRIIARPSGTEPKIKFYFSTVSEVHCENCIKAGDEEHLELKQAFMDLIKK
ncbi:MAG: phospho-sugar mutase [Brevinema sp.]